MPHRPKTIVQPALDGTTGLMGETYSGAGVDIAAGEAAVDRIKAIVRSTYRPEVLGDIGGFGGLFDAAATATSDPVLVSSTDGVGTKAMVATAAGRFDTIGIDLVAMCVDDIVCQGAEPLFFLDYISVGAPRPRRRSRRWSPAWPRAAARPGAPWSAARWPSTPGRMAPGEFDLVGFVVGVVERDRILTGDDARAGDVLVGLPSPGPALQRLLAGPPGAVRPWPASRSTTSCSPGAHRGRRAAARRR